MGATEVVGTKWGRVYHLPACQFIRMSRLVHRVTWTTPEEALRAGRRPCLACNPPASSRQPGTYAATFDPEKGYGS